MTTQRVEIHLSRAKSYIGKGEDFYRKAAEEIVAAMKEDTTLGFDRVAAIVGKSAQWCRDIVRWHTNPQSTGRGNAVSPYAEQSGEVAKRHARSVLRKAEPQEIAEQLLADPAIRAKVAKAQEIVYQQTAETFREKAETLRDNKREREIERKGGAEQHSEFERRQRVSEVVNVARGAASGLRFVAGQVKELRLADDDSGVASELTDLMVEIDGFVSLLRAYLAGTEVTDADIASLIGDGRE